MQIYAHRGASADFPEHSAEAYFGAIKQGADGFECDLRLTKDGVAVLWHDADEVATSTLSELQNIKPDLMTIDDFLDIAITHKKNVAIETKHPVPSGNAIEEVVIRKLEEHNAGKKIEVSLMSFSLLAVNFLKKKSNYEVVQLIEDRLFAIKSRISTPDVFAPSINVIRQHPEVVKKYHDNDKKVFVWTVDYDADIELCENLGVDVLITNIPSQARKVLGYS